MKYLIPLLVLFRILTNDGMFSTQRKMPAKKCHPKLGWFRNEKERDISGFLRGIDFPLFFMYNYL
jgi:hypothetical protein